jgi:hypothetical protein
VAPRRRSLGARRLSITVAGDDPRAVPFWTAMTASGWEHDERAIRSVKTVRGDARDQAPQTPTPG